MILIYPTDPSTRFLEPILTKVKDIPGIIIDKSTNEGYEETIKMLIKFNNETVLFIGHGSSYSLSGGCYVRDGRKQLVSRAVAGEIFSNKKLVLLSCRSADFIEAIKNKIDVAIGFGNIITDKEDLEGKADKKKYGDFNCIRAFRDRLVRSFAASIHNALVNNLNFEDLYKNLKLRINKEICLSSISKDPVDQLVGELFFDLKQKMIIYGNGKILVRDNP